MVINTEPIRQVIEIDIDKNSATKSLDFARDTWKKIDKELQRKLQIDILQAQAKIDIVKKQISDAKKAGEIPFALQLDLKNLQSGLTQAKRELNNLENTGSNTTSRLQAKFNQLGQGISGAFSKVAWAIAALWVWQFFRWVIDEAIAAERATAQLGAVIKSTWWAVWLTAKEIQAMAVELGKLNGVDNDVVASAQNMLLTFTNIRWAAFEPATQAVLDLATAMNGGLTPSSEELSKTAIQVGKALNDPIKWIGALSKVWVTFSEVQREQIKNFIEWWETAKAQAIILAELNREFGGSAAAQLETYGGKVQALTVSFNDFKESLGNAIIPVLSRIIGAIAPVVDSIKKFTSENPKLTSSLSLVTIWVTALAWALALLWWPITVAVAWFVALAGAGVWLVNSYNRMTDAISKYREWLTDLNGNLTESGKEYEATKVKIQQNKEAIDANNASIEAFNKLNFSQSGTRAEYEATRKKAIEAANANIALAKSFLAVAQATKWADNIWRWFANPLDPLWFWVIDANIKAQKQKIADTTKDLEKIIAWVFTWSGNVWWGGGVTGKAKKELTELEKAQQKAIEEQKKVREEFEKTINTDNIKAATDALTNTSSYEDAIQQIGILTTELDNAWLSGQQLWNELFKALDSAEQKSQSTIDSITKSIADLNTQIDNLWKGKDEKLADRLAAIAEETSKLQEQQNAGTIDTAGQQKLVDLANERAEAFAGLNQSQISALDELVAKQLEYNALTEVGKILADFELEKAALNDKLLLKQAELEKEQDRLLVFDKFKELLAQQQTAIQDNFAFEVGIADALIAKRNAVARARAAAGVAGGNVGWGSNTTNNTNSNSVNNNNNNITVNVNWPSAWGVIDAINNNIT